jgi:NTE family protein
LETKVLEEYFKADLPEKLETLSIKTFIGATDLYSAKLILFSKGMLLPPLLGSMALPGIFPSVPYQHFLLNDGGIVDNFPTAIAQQAYPEHKIIGIALNKFIEQQQPKNLIQTLIITFEIMMRKDLIQGIKEIAIAFYEKIDCGILELDKKKRKKAFEQGYASGVKKFKAL